MALPLVSTIKMPKSRRVRMIGRSQNFFLTGVPLIRLFQVFLQVLMFTFNQY
jgi:hypothetical protein